MNSFNYYMGLPFVGNNPGNAVVYMALMERPTFVNSGISIAVAQSEFSKEYPHFTNCWLHYIYKYMFEYDLTKVENYIKDLSSKIE